MEIYNEFSKSWCLTSNVTPIRKDSIVSVNDVIYFIGELSIDSDDRQGSRFIIASIHLSRSGKV